MKVETIDGIRVITLYDSAPQHGVDQDTVTMLHIWRLLSGGHEMRDNSACARRYI
jgi:hypothetical protein